MERQAKTDSWLQQLRVLEQNHATGLVTVATVTNLTHQAQHAILFIRTLNILLYKIRDHELHCHSPLIQSEVMIARSIVDHMYANMGPQYSSALLWPMMVLLCAVSNSALFSVLLEQLSSSHSLLSPAHYEWQSGAVKGIKSKRIRLGQTELHDGLDLLLSQNGLLALSIDESVVL